MAPVSLDRLVTDAMRVEAVPHAIVEGGEGYSGLNSDSIRPTPKASEPMPQAKLCTAGRPAMGGSLCFVGMD